jgi:hypothetical protein
LRLEDREGIWKILVKQERMREQKRDETGPEQYPVAGFVISGVEPSGKYYIRKTLKQQLNDGEVLYAGHTQIIPLQRNI